MNDTHNFQVTLKIKNGILNIEHPDGTENLIYAIYYAALAHQILLQKSVMPPPPPTIVPARTLPNERTH
jgi:hypothetical protein